ncbi:MAG: RNA polymerase sigma factor [Gammaproteobacteria bacterium]
MGQAALAERLQVHWDELAGYLRRRLGDPTLASDLTQEAFLRLAELPDDAAILNPRGYLFAVAQRLLADHWRSTHVRYEGSAGEGFLERVVDPAPPPDVALANRQAVVVLSRTIEKLPPRTREVFRLHKFENLTYIEIGKRLGMARNTVMVHMTLALGRCRDALAEHWQRGD